MILNRLRKFLLIGTALLILAGGGLFATLRYVTSPNKDTPLIYSKNALLLELWDSYKTNNIEKGSGRTLDKSQDNITTSEGESYTMLRSVWMDDKVTFDSSWKFTKNNMQRQNDYLMSWKFGKEANGNYGILTDIGGQNTASDADSDIALSLMMAYTRWNQADYLYQAKQIINSIWDQEVVSVAGKPVLTADNLEKNSLSTIVVNPSYFSPYAYKLFARVDKTHDWTGLSNNSYTLLTSLSSSMLDKSSSAGLPPDWVELNRTTGAVLPATSPNLDTNYGYDAFRTPWRLALDYSWNKDPRDKSLLETFSLLSNEWTKNGSLKTVYAHDGTTAYDAAGKVIGNYESPAMYGTAMGYFSVVDPAIAAAIYKHKLLPLYNPDTQQWKTALSYYDDNWAWFGIALHLNALPNLAIMSN